MIIHSWSQTTARENPKDITTTVSYTLKGKNLTLTTNKTFQEIVKQLQNK